MIVLDNSKINVCYCVALITLFFTQCHTRDGVFTVGYQMEGLTQKGYICNDYSSELGIERNLFHILGRYHEHNRNDRDHYVRVNWENVLEG